ncbi:dicarboxylate/amino acid:cation symporter [Pseudoalteromonas sp. McH1-7]|uniref:dicarboxylate/amino acid:cation symporter n=1 Tax=unclassified Pseudoalteromonas TaxID=194690 RepID=UPI0015923F15|nr:MULTISPECIES: dicarboxylate/amino acid:cation symporter [unclassified Pseudoalteromonas]NUZ09429.1 dicarboxylate/amino acid:cation symporter [Pseudoalteromonas sp. McH1-7]USD29777.1 dicarboxylate/amino acid:cation symporter [Pseudoalteromonas sp. SCSIO 43201]
MKTTYSISYFLQKKMLWLQIVVALILGITVGILLSPKGVGLVSAELSLQIAQWVALPGNLFLALIQMVVIPLVLSSIILGIAGNKDTAFLKQVGLRIFPYFVMTTFIAVIIGLVVASYIEPGKYVDSQLLDNLNSQHTTTVTATVELKSIPERMVAIIPSNITQSTLDKDMFAIVMYAIFIGIAITTLTQKQKSLLLELTTTAQTLSLQIVNWAMLLAPFAVFGLLCDITIRIGIDALLGVSAYVATVLLGLLLLMFVYLFLASSAGKISPWRFLSAIKGAQLLAFSTSSSAAVMPLSMRTAEQPLSVKKPIVQFIIPLGATINMDGTALYQVIAALFLTQVFGITLSDSQILLLILTTVGASIGSPSTPGVGIVILASVLTSFGIPAAGIALILGVDRILDMCRTVLNVTGDLTACVVMERLIKLDTTPKNAIDDGEKSTA